MRALYWLYLGVRMFYFNPSWYQIVEDSADAFSEKEENVIPIENVEPEQSLFQQILNTAKLIHRTFEDPWQFQFQLENQFQIPTNNPLRELLLFEYQTFLHTTATSPEQVNKNICDFIFDE